MLLPAELNTFIHQPASGIWFHPSQFYIRNVFLLQGLFDTVQKAGTHNASAAVMDQHPAAAKPLYITSGMVLLPVSKSKIRWAVKRKILHAVFSFPELSFQILRGLYQISISFKNLYSVSVFFLKLLSHKAAESAARFLLLRLHNFLKASGILLYPP